MPTQEREVSAEQMPREQGLEQMRSEVELKIADARAEADSLTMMLEGQGEDETLKAEVSALNGEIQDLEHQAEGLKELELAYQDPDAEFVDEMTVVKRGVYERFSKMSAEEKGKFFDEKVEEYAASIAGAEAAMKKLNAEVSALFEGIYGTSRREFGSTPVGGDFSSIAFDVPNEKLVTVEKIKRDAKPIDIDHFGENVLRMGPEKALEFARRAGPLIREATALAKERLQKQIELSIGNRDGFSHLPLELRVNGMQQVAVERNGYTMRQVAYVASAGFDLQHYRDFRKGKG